MFGVVQFYKIHVIKDKSGGLELNAVFSDIGGVLVVVPLKPRAVVDMNH